MPAKRDDDAPTPDVVRDGSHGRHDDPDRALKSAIHAAVEAGLFDRARALLDVLTKTGQPASVVLLREPRSR